MLSSGAEAGDAAGATSLWAEDRPERCKLDNVDNVSTVSPCSYREPRAMAARSSPPLEGLPALQRCRVLPKDTELQEQSAFLIFR